MPESYDDGGFTGANMDRPALTRLLHAVEAGGVDCVVVYKVEPKTAPKIKGLVWRICGYRRLPGDRGGITAAGVRAAVSMGSGLLLTC